MKNKVIRHFTVFTLGLCAAMFFAANTYAQNGFDVRGTISSSGQPLEGATVVEKGTNNGTSTDADGRFHLKVADGNAILEISIVGYQTRTEPLSNRHNIEVDMHLISQELDDVVVTALGITRKAKALGYSVSDLSSQQINNVPHENVLTAMQGKVPGVTINQTGGEGSSVSMIIRGANSLSNDNQPLFVVDGIPISNDLNNAGGAGDGNNVDFGNALGSINPEDIENISILKGPSAAALYGTRAGNGVVLITTKSGAGVDKLTVNVSSSNVWDKPYQYLFTEKRYGSGQFPGIPVNLTGNLLTNPLQILSGGDPNLASIDFTSGGNGGTELDRGYLAIQWNSPLDENGKPIPIPLRSYPDNAKNFLKTGFTTQNSVSMANQSKNINYRVSYSNMTYSGLIPETDLHRNTLSVNAILKAGEKVQVSTGINLSRNNADNRPATGRGTNPLYALYNLPSNVNVLDLKQYWEPGLEGLTQRSPNKDVFDNPYFLANEVKNGFVRDRFFGNIRMDWKIVSHLSLMLRYGLDTYNETRETKIPYSYTNDPRGAYSITQLKPFEGNADFLLTYDNNFSDFSLTASVGGSNRYVHDSRMFAGSKSNTGLVNPGVYTLQNILPANLDYGSFDSRRQINSVYGTATLGFKDYAFLDVSARNDWSSTLPGGMSYFYPSGSLSLILDEIFGFKSSNVNLVKLRGGIAQVGNDADPYRLEASLVNVGTWGNIPRLSTSSTLLNPNLAPEKITSYEGGFDLRFLQSRLRLSGTWYQIEDQRQIFSTQLTSETGYTFRNINSGLVRTRGIEGVLGITPINSADWNLDINVNITHEKTKIVSLAPGQAYFEEWNSGHGTSRSYVGEERGNLRGTAVRVVTDEKSPYYGYPLLGFDDSFPKWDKGEENVKIGNYNPDFILGSQVALRYKNWSLSATLEWRHGGDFVSKTMMYGMENGFATKQFSQFYDAGQLTGKELRDYLVAHADELIKVNGNHFPRYGWPTPEFTSYPFVLEGTRVPFGGLFIPGVIATGYDADGNPTGYIENLGENILGEDPDNPNYTWPVPYAAANPWSFQQSVTFPADYFKLRELTISYKLPNTWLENMKINGATVSVFTRNIIIWTKAKIRIDPERAYEISGSGFNQGIELFNLNPWVFPIGVKLNLTF